MPGDKCPYCLAPMEPKQMQYKLTHRQWEVYSAVVHAGPEGIRIGDLLEEVMPGRSPGTVRTLVCALNKVIAPQAVKARGGIYHLERDETCDLPEGMPKS